MNDLIFYLLMAVFGGIISLAKDWKSSSLKRFISINFFTILAFVLLIIGAWKAFEVGQIALDEKAISDSTSKAKDFLSNIYRDSLISSQNQLLSLEKRQLDTADKIITLNSLLIASQNEVLNYQTGGNSIPLFIPVVRYYALDHFSRWNGPQIPEYVDNWIMEFEVKNSGSYPITNIRSYRTMTGSNIEKDSATFTLQILGPREEKELQKTYILGSGLSVSGTYSIYVHVQWALNSYDCHVDIGLDEFKDSQGNPYHGYVPKTTYVYRTHSYSKVDDLQKAILSSHL